MHLDPLDITVTVHVDEEPALVLDSAGRLLAPADPTLRAAVALALARAAAVLAASTSEA